MPIQQQLSSPVNAFIQGRAARQQYDAGETRNALAQMELDNAPQEMAARNRLLDVQTQSAEQGLSAEKAKFAYTTLKQAIDSGNPRAFVLQNVPDLASNLQRQGIDLQSMDDAQAAQLVDGLARKYAGEAGIAPTVQMQTIGDTNNPGAGILQKDPTTGALKQVVAPQKPDHFAEAEAGRNARSAASIAARPSQMTGNDDNVEMAAKAISNYQQSPLGSMAMRSPYGQAVMARVMELNPDYQANEFGARSKAYKDFASGKNGNQVRSFNVAISHLDSLQKIADTMDNGDLPALNKLRNEFARQTGKAAPNTFEGMKKIVTDEIVKSIVGAGGGVADREEAAATISAANSPAQLAGIMNGYKELMAGQLGGLKQQYEQTTGRKDFGRFLTKEAQGYLDSHVLATDQPPPTPKGAAEVTATGPNGQKVVLRNGQWVPLGQ